MKSRLKGMKTSRGYFDVYVMSLIIVLAGSGIGYGIYLGQKDIAQANQKPEIVASGIRPSIKSEDYSVFTGMD